MPDLRAEDESLHVGDFSDRLFEPLESSSAEAIDFRQISEALRAATWEIEHVPSFSPWGTHIPFLFGLVTLIQPRVYVDLGAQGGASFFGACQAVQRQCYDSRLVAVDNWSGGPDADNTAGGEFDNVRRIIAEKYAGSAGYLRADFSEALAHFAPGSIDLLHMGGFRTETTAREGFTTWLDRMSDRGVVIVHDINEFRQDFGVWRFWRQVREQYPSIEFGHGHGLGVLVVGESSPLRLPIKGTDIVPTSPEVNNQLQLLFAGLGHLSWSQAKESAASRTLQREFGDRQLYREQVMATELKALQREVRVAQQNVDRLTAKLDDREARIVAFRERVEQLKQKAGAARERAEKLRSERDALRSKLGVSREQRDRLRNRVARMAEELGAAQARVAELEASTSWRITRPLRAIRRPGRRGQG